MFVIFGDRNAADLLQQSLLAISHEEHLILTEISQLLRGFASADTTLVTAKAVEEAF